MADNPTPVLILRSDSHGGLNIMRSLGRLGVPVFNVDPNRSAPAFFSKYCRGRFLWDIEHAPAARSLDYLATAAQRIGGKPILIPTTDRTTMFLADNAAALRHRFMFPDQPAGLVRRLCSKIEMFQLAKHAGIPTPDTVAPRNVVDVLRFADRASFPVMIKAIDGQLLWERCRKKMFIVRTADDLLEKYCDLEDPTHPNLILQEYIPGGDDTVWMFNGYFDKASQCLVAFTGKKIRQCPVYTGSTSLGICLHNPAVEKLTLKFMTAVAYRGILDIGFRYDARDGQYKVLDVNPRIGATFRLFVGQNAVDVARALYLDLTGQRVPHGEAREGRKWFVEDLDLVSSYRYYRDGKLTFAQWLESFRDVEEAAFFAWDDLFPMIPMIAARAIELWRRVVGAARARLIRWIDSSPIVSSLREVKKVIRRKRPLMPSSVNERVRFSETESSHRV